MNDKVKKYLAESALIVFSVLFALFINQLAQNYALEERKQVALTSIKEELRSNLEIVSKWNEDHSRAFEKVEKLSAGENNSLKENLYADGHIQVFELTDDKPIVSSIPTNTAWETARTTGIVSELDFSAIKSLTTTYGAQSFIVDHTMVELRRFLLSDEANDEKRVERNIVQLKLRFGELVVQESALISLYERALKDLK